jgi:hypothetical protein
MFNDGLPNDWTTDRNRSEFVKWLRILHRLVELGPTDWGLWQQTREAQELLARLARRLGFDRGPIERRKETIEFVTADGRELHQREYVIATDPANPSAAEQFDASIHYLDSSPRRICYDNSGGMSDAAFRQEVLTRLERWLQAVGGNP